MAEVSSKVEIENVGERKCEVGVSESRDLANGKSLSCHGNGNAEEADGSYVFVSHKESLGDDHANSDVKCKAVENEEKNVDQKAENNGGIDDSSVLQLSGEEDLGELKPEKREGATSAEEKKESDIEVPADDLTPNIISGNEKLIMVEPSEKVEESPDLKVQEPVEEEEKSEGQTKPDLGIDAEENQEIKTIVSEVSKQDKNEEKNAVDSGQVRESGDLIADEISSDGPSVDRDVFTEQINQTGTGSAASISSETKPTAPAEISNDGSEPIITIPDSDENINVQSEAEVIKAPVSVENCDEGSESAAPTTFESDVRSDLDDTKVLASDENVDLQSDSSSVEIPDFDQNEHVRSESKSDVVTDPNEIVNVHSESEAIDVPNCDQNGGKESEPGVVDVDSSESGNVQSESEAVEVPGSDENGDAQSESRAVNVTDPNPNNNVRLESEAVDVPGCHVNEEIRSESRNLDISAPYEHDCGQSESEGASVPPPDQDDKAHLKSEAISISALDHNDSVQLQSKTVSAPASDERHKDLVLNDVVVESVDTSTGNTISGDAELEVRPELEAGPEKGGCCSTGHGQKRDGETITGSDTDICQNTNQEAKGSIDGGLSENLLVDETKPVTLDESINATDFEVRTQKKSEDSADDAADGAAIVGAESDFVQSDETFGKPVGSDIDCIKRDIEVELVKNGVEANQKDVCEDTSIEDNFEPSNIKENSTSGMEGGTGTKSEVVEPEVKSSQTDDSPHLNNDTVEVSIKNELEDNENKLSRAAEMSPSNAKSIVAKSTLWSDTVHLDDQTEASGSIVGSAVSELAETDAIEHESVMSNCPGENANTEVNVDVATVEETNLSSLKSDGVIISQRGDSSEGNNVASDIERKPFYFLCRVPRYDDEKLAEEIRHAQLQVDKKTESRDTIRAEIQKIRVSCKEFDNSCKAAAADERSAREALRSKRQDIDSLQSLINRVKNAMSVDDIDSRIVNMEHMIQHETLPLKEEKQLIRDIKQLKQLREQITSTMGTQDEVQKALDEKDQTEERLKVVRKELDMLRSNLSKYEAVNKAAWKKYQDERDKLNQLHNQFKAADSVRQEAFVHLQSLRKQSREKNKYFFKYRDNSKAANDLALSKDKDSLQNFCIDQVETFMNLWNNNDEFRNDYIRCNRRSTLRRFGTSDARSLGPDEEPPIVSRPLNVRLAKSTAPSERTEKHEAVLPVVTKTEKIIHVKDVKLEDDKPVTQTGEQKIQTKTVKAVKQVPPASVLPAASSKDETVEPTEEEEPKLSKEDEELARKVEEKRKQKEAAKLKEQRRLEEIAKAKEAMERKKKKEEKAKVKAALRAQKEAEEREKEREKRLKKKERRKGINSDDAVATPEEQSVLGSEAQSESRNEAELPQKQDTPQPKRSNRKPTQFTKLNKSTPIPLPLRNRGKRRVQPWMWGVIIALLVIALFLVGNGGFSFGSRLRSFSF